MVRNFLHKLCGTGSLHECHSKHSPTSRLLWTRHRQWGFSILPLPLPSFSRVPQRGICWNTHEGSAAEAQNLWCGCMPVIEMCPIWQPSLSALKPIGAYSTFCWTGPWWQAMPFAIPESQKYTDKNPPQSDKINYIYMFDNFSTLCALLVNLFGSVPLWLSFLPSSMMSFGII